MHAVGVVCAGCCGATWGFLRPSAAATAAAAAALQVFTMSVSDRRAVIGTSNRHIWVYDMRSLAEPEQRRLSSLKFQTRCVRVFPDQEGYAVGSVEGRVAVEYFDTSKVRFGGGGVFRRGILPTLVALTAVEVGCAVGVRDRGVHALMCVSRSSVRCVCCLLLSLTAAAARFFFFLHLHTEYLGT